MKTDSEYFYGKVSEEERKTLFDRYPWLVNGIINNKRIQDIHFENRTILENPEDNKNALSSSLVRWHHLKSWMIFAENWYGNYLTSPWQLPISDFKYIAREFSALWSDAYLKSILRTKSSDYKGDVLGSNNAHHASFCLSNYIVSYNYLLKSRQNSFFADLTSNSDDICHICQGGVNGVGKHCQDNTSISESIVKQVMLFHMRKNGWKNDENIRVRNNKVLKSSYSISHMFLLSRELYKEGSLDCLSVLYNTSYFDYLDELFGKFKASK